MPVSTQLNVHMSDERAVIAGKFRRARYVISIKARTHNYTAREGSPCRNTVVNIFQFCAQLEGKKNHGRERRKNETKTENQRKGERARAHPFLLSLQKTYSFSAYFREHLPLSPFTPPPLFLCIFVSLFSLLAVTFYPPHHP